MDSETRHFLDVINSHSLADVSSIGVEESRVILRDLFIEHAPQRVSVGSYKRQQLRRGTGEFPVDIFWPPGTINSTALPVVLFVHGGGWIQGDLACYENVVRQLCVSSGAAFVSVGYHLAPESVFPTGLEDCDFALQWLRNHADALGLNKDKIALMGDSAGGNLVAALTLLCRDRKQADITAQFLLYPVLDVSGERNYHSREQFGGGEFLLSQAQIDWTCSLYLSDPGLVTDKRVSPLCEPDLTGLPPTTIITAGFDPLKDEGKKYAEKLQLAGVSVEFICFNSTIHGFLSLAGSLAEGRRGLALLARKVNQQLFIES